jgi:biopolymer transport protein ExbB/TolQ
MNNFSIREMFLNADPVVQGVMIILLLASLSSWVVIFEKIAVMGKVSRQVWFFKKIAKDMGSELQISDLPGFTALLFEAGKIESQDIAGDESRKDYRERIERTMRVILSGRIDRLESRVSLLATVGSTCPFIGLFGTVWGIMHSFIGIAASGETTLAVVAPGIAEALLATAMGLVAAIPAVIGYNKINSTIKKITRESLSAIGILGNHLAQIYFTKNNH